MRRYWVCACARHHLCNLVTDLVHVQATTLNVVAVAGSSRVIVVAPLSRSVTRRECAGARVHGCESARICEYPSARVRVRECASVKGPA